MRHDDEFFRDLCENAHDLIQSVDCDGRFLYVNRAWLDTLGYAREDLEKLELLDVIHPASRDQCTQTLARLREGKPKVHIETAFVAKDGRMVLVEGTATCRFEDGVPVSTRGLFRDVTDRERAREDRDRLFDLSLDMLCVASMDGYFKLVNPAFERVLGYTREELLSRRFIEFVHEDDRGDTLAVMGDLATGKTVVDFRNRYLTRAGEYHWLAWRATPVPDRQLIYATARDVTREMETRELMARQAEELARSNADLEQFASVASHDLRAPLRGIASLLDWIEQELPDSVQESVNKNIGRIRDQVERMGRLTADLLAYSRVGRMDEMFAAVDTVELVRELWAMLDPPSRFEIEVDRSLPTLRTVRAPLEQVLRNLIANAIEHHDRDAGKVSVSARRRGDEWEFSVADDGPGIPRGSEDEIFNMFHRLNRGRDGSGTGVGLALVKKIVETHGGRIELVQSSGRGAKFRFTWPARLDPRGARAEDPDR